MWKIGVLALCCLGLLGCSQTTKRIEGTVSKISGTLPGLVKASGALFGNESVRLGDGSLVYTVAAADGDYTLSIAEDSDMPRANLVARICVGTKINFTVRETDESDAEATQDPHFHAGVNPSSDIAVPHPCIQK